MTNIIKLPIKPLAIVAEEPNAPLVEMIRDLLKLAESGALRSVSIAGQLTGTGVFLLSTGNPVKALGMLELLKAYVIDEMYADEDEE